MASNRLWDTWMVAVGWILVVFGILLAFANQTRLFDVVFNNQVNTVFWSSRWRLRASCLFSGSSMACSA